MSWTQPPLNGCLLAVDEFHHVSGNEDSRLGELVRGIMSHSTAHLVAMTGSYFRGDSQPVLLPEDEAKFTGVTYNYYEQLNGYEHLKSLGIGYHFYQGRYMSAIGECWTRTKKPSCTFPMSARVNPRRTSMERWGPSSISSVRSCPLTQKRVS
jgi:hypothetical protein